MKMPIRAAFALLAALACAPLSAGPPTKAPVALAPGGQIVAGDPIQESYSLASANASAGAVTLLGGDYVLDQVCSAYGTLKLQRLGPDGATWLDTISKTTADTTTGTGLTFGSLAQVRVALSGTTGCAATLARVP